jgi:hypothetical protein
MRRRAPRSDPAGELLLQAVRCVMAGRPGSAHARHLPAYQEALRRFLPAAEALAWSVAWRPLLALALEVAHQEAPAAALIARLDARICKVKNARPFMGGRLTPSTTAPVDGWRDRKDLA